MYKRQLFTVSIPVICLSQEVFGIMLLGRILQGASAGIVGVVVPLYPVSYTHLDVYKRQGSIRMSQMPSSCSCSASGVWEVA